MYKNSTKQGTDPQNSSGKRRAAIGDSKSIHTKYDYDLYL